MPVVLAFLIPGLSPGVVVVAVVVDVFPSESVSVTVDVEVTGWIASLVWFPTRSSSVSPADMPSSALSSSYRISPGSPVVMET